MSRSDPWLPQIRAQPEKWLAQIIRAGNSELALELIRDNPQLLAARFSGNTTPLLEAAYAGQCTLAEILLGMGAKLDFITAIVLGRKATVRAMLDRVLHCAALAGNVNLVRFLLAHGARKDLQTDGRKLRGHSRCGAVFGG